MILTHSRCRCHSCVTQQFLLSHKITIDFQSAFAAAAASHSRSLLHGISASQPAALGGTCCRGVKETDPSVHPSVEFSRSDSFLCAHFRRRSSRTKKPALLNYSIHWRFFSRVGGVSSGQKRKCCCCCCLVRTDQRDGRRADSRAEVPACLSALLPASAVGI